MLTKIILIFYLSLHPSRYTLANNIVIYNPVVTNWGEWGTWDKCSNGTFAVAFQLKTEAYIEWDDDTALNGIRLYCDTPGQNGVSEYVTSSIGEWGHWGQVFYCEGLLTGFQMKSEEQLSGDNTAANNMKGFCATPNVNKNIIEGDGQNWGSWTRAQNCLQRQSICGIRTQVQSYIGSDDDTALNNIQVECCDIPNPAKTCTPMDAWELLIECDNSEGLVPLKCTFERKNGITVSHSDSGSGSTETSTMLSVGYTLDYVGQFLSSNFKTNLEISVITKHDWKTESSQTWSEESTHSAEFIVDPGMVSSLFQVVGNCKYFDVFTTKFRKRDRFNTTSCSGELITEKVFVWDYKSSQFPH